MAISLSVLELRRYRSWRADRKQWVDWTLPETVSFRQAEGKYLVALVYEDSVRRENNPFALPRGLSQNRRFLRCLPVHPSLKIDHGV